VYITPVAAISVSPVISRRCAAKRLGQNASPRGDRA
jgi:hypothetical protein